MCSIFTNNTSRKEKYIQRKLLLMSLTESDYRWRSKYASSLNAKLIFEVVLQQMAILKVRNGFFDAFSFVIWLCTPEWKHFIVTEHTIYLFYFFFIPISYLSSQISLQPFYLSLFTDTWMVLLNSFGFCSPEIKLNG